MGWIGVDFDGTLAEYHGYTPMLGKPVPAMVERVKKWLEEGREVRIFTARLQMEHWRIAAWCKEHVGAVLPITNLKDYKMEVLYDDRAVQVEQNTGRLISAPETVTTSYRCSDEYDNEVWECLRCHEEQIFLEAGPRENNFHYCPNCGAKITALIMKAKPDFVGGDEEEMEA